MNTFRIANRITKKETTSFRKYLNDIAAIPVMSLDEETECCIKVAQGDLEAKEELIVKNLRFVVSVAKQYETSSVVLEELVEEGNVGLILAASRFDHTKGYRFITFAVNWIKKLMFEYISNSSKPIRIPCNKVSAMRKFTNKVSEMEQRYGRTVDTLEVLEELSDSLPIKEIENLEKYLNLKVDSLDKAINQDDGETSLHELLSDDSLDAPDSNLAEDDTKTEINLMLRKLKPRDRQIVCDLFGLNGHTPKTLEQISVQVGLTREMVRQIKEKSLKTLKKELFK